LNGASISQTKTVTARKFVYATNNSPSNTCALAYGTNRTYVYTIYTHPDGQPVSPDEGLDGTAATETFSPALTCGQNTGDGELNASGQFSDHLSSVCSSTPLTCSDPTTQALSVAGFTVRTNALVWSSTGVAYTSNGPTQREFPPLCASPSWPSFQRLAKPRPSGRHPRGSLLR
jgi:hypothetical protein